MTLARQLPTSWGTRRFVLVAGLIFVLQLLLVGVLSARRVAFPLRYAAGQAPAMVWLPGTDPLLAEFPDTATLAVVNRRGFSGPLWAGSSRWRLVAGFAAEEALALDSVSSISPSFPRTQPGLPSPAEFSLPALTPSAAPPVSVPRTLLPETSVLRVGGEVRSRRIVDSSPPLPSWTNLEVLAATTVQIVVDRSGGVLSAALQPPGSGLATADQLALQRARSLRFEPATGTSPGLQWGTLEFVWRTLAITAAAAPAAASPP